jgi:hypothetical protein
VADLRVDVAGTLIQPSVSIGVVSYPDDGRTSDELMITADSSMYHSKRSGKNRVTGVPVVATDFTEDIPPAQSRRGRAAGGPGPAVVSSGRSRARAAPASHPDNSV